MVAMSPTATLNSYSQLELHRREVMSKRQFVQTWPPRLALCLPWCEFPAREHLDETSMARLEAAFEQVDEIGIGKTILLEEHGYLWMVHVAPYPGCDGYQITWRFICQDQE